MNGQSTGGTATMIAMGSGVLITLNDAKMTTVMDPDHTGTGTFTFNGTLQADCFIGD